MTAVLGLCAALLAFVGLVLDHRVPEPVKRRHLERIARLAERLGQVRAARLVADEAGFAARLLRKLFGPRLLSARRFGSVPAFYVLAVCLGYGIIEAARWKAECPCGHPSTRSTSTPASRYTTRRFLPACRFPSCSAPGSVMAARSAAT